MSPRSTLRARARDSVPHKVIIDAMLPRGIPKSVALVYAREATRAGMTMHHAAWQTLPIRAGVGGAPWGSARAASAVREGRGLDLQTTTLTHLAWAGNSWLMDSAPESLDTMLTEFRETA